eukprot:1159436-Pelagomonas_calceolata.AAC.7
MDWDLLHKEGKPVMQRLLVLLLEVASGMLYLHNRQIIHIDLKMHAYFGITGELGFMVNNCMGPAYCEPSLNK